MRTIPLFLLSLSVVACTGSDPITQTPDPATPADEGAQTPTAGGEQGQPGEQAPAQDNPPPAEPPAPEPAPAPAPEPPGEWSPGDAPNDEHHPAELVGTWLGFAGDYYSYELTFRADGTASSKAWKGRNPTGAPVYVNEKCAWQVDAKGPAAPESPWALLHSCTDSPNDHATLAVVGVKPDAFLVRVSAYALEAFRRVNR